MQSIFIVLVSPLCFLKTMSALSFTSFLSIITVFCLAAVICARSIGYNTSIAPEPAPHHNASQVPTVPIKFFADSFEDALYGIPIFSVAFLCHFNVLPLKGELRRPTRSRLQRVIRTTILTCASLYIIVAYSGYLEFRSRTCGNILQFSCGRFCRNLRSNRPCVHTDLQLPTAGTAKQKRAPLFDGLSFARGMPFRCKRS